MAHMSRILLVLTVLAAIQRSPQAFAQTLAPFTTLKARP